MFVFAVRSSTPPLPLVKLRHFTQILVVSRPRGCLFTCRTCATQVFPVALVIHCDSVILQTTKYRYFVGESRQTACAFVCASAFVSARVPCHGACACTICPVILSARAFSLPCVPVEFLKINHGSAQMQLSTCTNDIHLCMGDTHWQHSS